MGHGQGWESARELERERPPFLGALVRRCSHGGGRWWRTKPWSEEEAFGESGWDGFWLVGTAAEGEREENIGGNRQRQQDRMHTISQSVSHHLGLGVAARHSGLDAAPTCETP
ncbi:hypothetical protein OIDMADRAFT_25360 [Oidiodendron maius Zn]|uniref:Uncharacterized protein n=1 Tax=Oidiodendron maius (strain Zn) TaxID=913774 RepID=A0A0C3H912_OIDMZ|nr:hypothetical protein OIDMADRAFT_25360 [Oidiodendron maius Zn]